MINNICGYWFKIKFNISNGHEDPLDLYKEDPDAVNVQWFLWHDKMRYFNKNQIAVCFLRISNDVWLLTTIKRITKLLKWMLRKK